MTSVSFIKNEIFLILCLKRNIEIIEPIVPPTSEENKSLFSEIRLTSLEFLSALNLS